jgi:hypothetical protein
MAVFGVLAFDFVVIRSIHLDLSLALSFSGGAQAEDRRRYYITSELTLRIIWNFLWL